MRADAAMMQTPNCKCRVLQPVLPAEHGRRAASHLRPGVPLGNRRPVSQRRADSSALAVKLRGRIEQRGDGLADQRRVMGRLSQRHGKLLAELGGISFVADRAVAAWETKGVSIFRRSLG